MARTRDVTATDAGGDAALTIRIPARLRAELGEAAGREGRSVSQEIAARLVAGGRSSATPLALLVSAFEERLALFYGSDWRDPDAAAALAAGLPLLLSKIATRSSPRVDPNAAATGEKMAEATHTWIRTRPDTEALALRAAFFGDAR